jgi:hypothetical protein
MMQIHTFDNRGVFAGTVLVSEFEALPVGTLIPPPTLTPPEVAQWQGDSWVVLPEYPPAPAPPPAPVPQAVTMRQARLALLGSGMLTSVNAAIAAMPGAQGEAARIEWEFSSEVKRNQPLVLALGPVLGLSASQLDQLFIVAGSL